MDADKFLNTVKSICEQRGIAPKTACRESGAGDNLINNVKNGSSPSVDKVQKLATYLGCSTSELLGEIPIASSASTSPNAQIFELTSREKEVILAYRRANNLTRQIVGMNLKPFGLSDTSEQAM